MKKQILEYNAIFQQEPEGGFSVWIPSLPGCASQGETFEEAMENIKEAIALYLEDEDEQEIVQEIRQQFMVPVMIAQ